PARGDIVPARPAPRHARCKLADASGRDHPPVRRGRAPTPRWRTAVSRTSLTRFLIEAQREGHINPQLRLLIEVVARACKRISVAVGKGALSDVLGDAVSGAGASSVNVQGEAQKKLDVLSNEILLEAN